MRALRIGKLSGAAVVARDVAGAIASQGFEELPTTVEDAERAGGLPGPHRDPFDRMLIAQAVARGLVLVSINRAFDEYGVPFTSAAFTSVLKGAGVPPGLLPAGQA